VFRDPEVSLKSLHVYAVYVLPSDRVDAPTDGWENRVTDLLSSCAAFHRKTFLDECVPVMTTDT
jgi:hypothetical protein